MIHYITKTYKEQLSIFNQVFSKRIESDQKLLEPTNIHYYLWRTLEPNTIIQNERNSQKHDEKQIGADSIE